MRILDRLAEQRTAKAAPGAPSAEDGTWGESLRPLLSRVVRYDE